MFIVSGSHVGGYMSVSRKSWRPKCPYCRGRSMIWRPWVNIVPKWWMCTSVSRTGHERKKKTSYWRFFTGNYNFFFFPPLHDEQARFRMWYCRNIWTRRMRCWYHLLDWSRFVLIHDTHQMKVKTVKTTELTGYYKPIPVLLGFFFLFKTHSPKSQTYLMCSFLSSTWASAEGFPLT